jgi:hypothetical protein
MAGANASANAGADVGAIVVPSCVAIARVEHITCIRRPLDERTDEARVGADVGEPAAGPKHASDLAEDAADVVNVRVDQRRAGGIEGAGVEREVSSVALYELDAVAHALPRQT